MAFAGLRGTGSWGTGERPKNFREMILWLQPNGSAPLTAILAKAKKEKVDDPEFNWWEEKLTGVRMATAADLSAASTTVTLAAVSATLKGGLSVVPGDVLLVEKTETATYDNELLVVSSVTSATEIVVKRGQAGSTAAGITSGANLTKVGNAFAEGTSSPSVSQRNPTKLLNYTQIFKTAMSQTRTATKTRARTGNAWENDKKRKSFDHAEAIEMAFLFGQKHETTGANGMPLRYTGGLRQFITTNVKIFTTSPTEDTFLAALTPVFDYSSKGMAGDERIVFAGNGFLNNLNKLAKDSSSTRINFDGVVNLYGMNLTKWVLPQGTIAVKTHPLMNVHARFKNSAFVLDPTGLIYRPLEGSDTQFQDNIQDKKSDTREAQWLTEVGLEVHHEETMAYIGNFVI